MYYIVYFTYINYHPDDACASIRSMTSSLERDRVYVIMIVVMQKGTMICRMSMLN